MWTRLCELGVEVASTRVRAGSRSAVDKLTIFAKLLLAIALAMTRCGNIFELSTCVEKRRDPNTTTCR